MNKPKTNDSINTFFNYWDANLYDSKHSFVSNFGTDLVELLSPQRGEHILDLGCGTGYLTEKIANSGPKVIGIDSASTMIEQARNNYPNLKFEVADGANLPFIEQFDAVFSNAVLHWIKPPEKVVRSVWRALKPGGKFVAEFGGKGNISTVISAIRNVMQAAGYPATELNPWYFPSIGEYGTLLEQQGLQLTYACLFNRPTPLEGREEGIENWLEMFANSFFQVVPHQQKLEILAEIANQLRPTLYRNGTWVVDYQRIRVLAIKNQETAIANISSNRSPIS